MSNIIEFPGGEEPPVADTIAEFYRRFEQYFADSRTPLSDKDKKTLRDHMAGPMAAWARSYLESVEKLGDMDDDSAKKAELALLAFMVDVYNERVQFEINFILMRR